MRRRVAIRGKLQKISEVYKPLGKGDVPDVRYCCSLSPVSDLGGQLIPYLYVVCNEQRVHQYINQEYARACLITFASSPKEGYQEGWGLPGKKEILALHRWLDDIDTML